MIANPPFSQNYSAESMKYKERFSHFMPETGKKADLMFVQHMVASLTSDGRLAVVMPHGVLRRHASGDPVLLPPLGEIAVPTPLARGQVAAREVVAGDRVGERAAQPHAAGGSLDRPRERVPLRPLDHGPHPGLVRPPAVLPPLETTPEPAVGDEVDVRAHLLDRRRRLSGRLGQGERAGAPERTVVPDGGGIGRDRRGRRVTLLEDPVRRSAGEQRQAAYDRTRSFHRRMVQMFEYTGSRGVPPRG